jgi:hypothetical protein
MSSDGIFQLLEEDLELVPSVTSAGRLRGRSKGREKYLFQVPLEGKLRLVSEAELLTSYRYIFTIDTNTVVMNDEHVSFGCIAVSTVRHSKDPDRTSIVSAIPGGFEFHGLASDQERLAWVLLQDAITGSPDFDADAQYLMITDHAQRSHPAINARAEPLFGQAYLAPNLTLAFATSESGNSISRKIMRACDRGSSHFLRAVCAGEVPDEGLKSLADAPVSRFRVVPFSSGGLPNDVTPFRLNVDTPFLSQFERGRGR